MNDLREFNQREVSKSEFFAKINDLDVHPEPRPERSIWRMRHTRKVIGISTPGWRNGYVDGVRQASRYYLVE